MCVFAHWPVSRRLSRQPGWFLPTTPPPPPSSPLKLSPLLLLPSHPPPSPSHHIQPLSSHQDSPRERLSLGGATGCNQEWAWGRKAGEPPTSTGVKGGLRSQLLEHCTASRVPLKLAAVHSAACIVPHTALCQCIVPRTVSTRTILNSLPHLLSYLLPLSFDS